MSQIQPLPGRAQLYTCLLPQDAKEHRVTRLEACDQETQPEGLYWFHVSTDESEEYVDEDGEIATRSTGRAIDEVVLADHSQDGSRHSFQGFNAEKHGAMEFDNIHHYAEVERPDVP